MIHSGTTTCQLAVYDIDKKKVSSPVLFKYGSKNQDKAAFKDMMQYIANHKQTIVVDAGAHGYAVQEGKIALTTDELLEKPTEKTKEAVQSARTMFEVLGKMGKCYVLPQRNVCELKTSPAEYLQTKYPDADVLDWGGGQIQNSSEKKKVPFDQRSLLN